VLRHARLVVAVILGITTLAAVRTFMTRSVYQGTVQILIQREAPKIVSFKEVTELESARDDYFQTQFKLLQSRSLARRVIESMSLMQDPEFGGPRNPDDVTAAVKAQPGESQLMEGTIDALIGRLKVLPVPNSRLVSVSVEAFRPELASRMANDLSLKYIEQTLEFRYKTSSEAAHWLGDQVEDERRKIQEAEDKLQKVREKDGVANLDERRTLLSQKLQELGSSLNALKAQRLEKEALFQHMRSAPNPEELPQVMQNPVVQQLRTDLANLERQHAELLERYLDKYPEVQKVKAQIEESRARLRSEAQRLIRSAENDYRTALAQEGKIAEALEAAKSESLELSRRSQTYDSYKRDVEAGKEVMNSLLSRHKETDVAQELKSSNIRIVDAAVVPRRPVRPNRPRDVAYGMLLGIAAGVGLAFLLEYLDNTIKTPDDIRLHLGAPMLGVISEMESKNPGPVLLQARPTGSFAEGYRVLRTALNYSWPERGPRVIVVTSTAPGEGKTLTSVNVALTLASSDGKVLLIDADLRKPQTHNLLKVGRRPGLSDVLVGKAKPSEAIQRVSGTNLSVLCSGTHVPSPADLMTTQVLEGLLAGLRGFYNWIVIDSAPVAAVSDALILSRATDGVIVVVGAEMVPRSAVRQTLERIMETGARVLGVVLNRAQMHRHSFYYGRYYGRYYGHYYGHYYGRYGPEPGTSNVARIKDRAAR
jgi:capsular exopolysaccharide synthesis family protein